jgi:hypothetical protein
MMLNERQYERVARWLDGEDVELAPLERAAAEEIRRDEAAIAIALDAFPPTETRRRAHRRLAAALAHPRIGWWRVAAAAAAAAAAVLIVVAFTRKAPQPQPTPTVVRPPERLHDEEPVEALIGLSAEDEIDLLTTDLVELTADIAAAEGPDGRGADIDVQIEVLEKELEEFYLYDMLDRPAEG